MYSVNLCNIFFYPENLFCKLFLLNYRIERERRLMSINCNNSDNHRINKLQVQDGKNSTNIDLNNLEGIDVKSSASLFEYLKKNKVNVDADGNGTVDKQEAKVLRQALIELAGENGVIDSKDFKKDIDSDKESRKSAFNSVKYLRGSGTIKYNDDGSFVKTIGYGNQTIISYDKDGNEVGGEINKEKFTTKVQEDGQELSLVERFVIILKKE